MIYEKSCGAVVYAFHHHKPLVLVEYMALGHVSLPKGHMEEGETEEQTAAREILEEVSRSVDTFVGEAQHFDDLTMLGLTMLK